MAVRIDKQNSPLGSPLVWMLILGLIAGGIWYYKFGRPKPEVVVEQPPPPPPPPKKEPDFVDLPPPPKDVPKPVVVVEDDTPKEPEKQKEAITPYSVPKDMKIVKPRYGKGPDALDKEMWEIDASPKKSFKWDKDMGKVLGPKIAQYMGKDARHTVANPNAAEFPGRVPDDAPRVQKVVHVPLSQSRWFSTGVYAPPGEIIRIEVNSDLKGATVVVGCHRDNIANSKRERTHRFPQISNSFKIEKSSVDVANPFGGLIYIDVPGKKEWEKSHTKCRVSITGGVESPLFVLGETTEAEWNRLRQAPAPWGEIGGKSHFAAARSMRFRQMPFATAKALAEYWDKAVDLQDWLCGWGPRRSPERMVPDAEISAGSGHSGYPYMGYLDWENWTDLEAITEQGSWGHFHELGHNHQSGAWTFAGYGEVTNNVMGLYCQDRLSKFKLKDWFARNRSVLARRLGPPPKEGAFENLTMYVPVLLAFGWEPLRNTWAEYRKRGEKSGLNLSTDDKKKETFVLLWSKHCKANLGPYFELFGFPYTPSMQTRLSSLKRFMPPNFPPKPGEDPEIDVPELPDHGSEMGGDSVNDN